MKRVYIIIIFLFCFHFSYCQHPYLLPGGTEIGIKTIGAFSGDYDLKELPGVVTSDIYDSTNKQIIIRSGTPVKLFCRILPPKTVGRPGKILITGATTSTVNGTTIDIISNFEFAGEGRSGTAHGLAWGLFPFTFGLSTLFLLIKGDKAAVLSQSLIPNNIVAKDYYIDLD